MNLTSKSYLLVLITIGVLAVQFLLISSFTITPQLGSSGKNNVNRLQCQRNDEDSISRRSFFATNTAALLASTAATTYVKPALAEESEQPSVQTPLYYILRVREATEQESRLIKSGKFKDVQRANVKLAVKFMLDNYRLNDNFISASAFLDGERKIKAVDIGQNTVQNLITILEYFDSSDVENIKVGSTGLGGKEAIVLNGLVSARKGIDDFVSLFPKDDVTAVISKIEAENELNRQEFDPALGTILNPKPTTQQS